MFSTTAYAQEVAPQAAQGGATGSLFMMLALFAIFYFLVIRPQSKREQQHRDMTQNLNKGDKIITQGGVLATVTKLIDDKLIQVEIAEGVKVKLARSFVFGLQSDKLETEAKADKTDKKEEAKEKKAS